LESTADGFRNYYDQGSNYLSPINAMIDKSNQLDLTPAQMTVLVGGLRVLSGSSNNADSGVFTDRKGLLTTDFFVNLLDMGTVWQPSADFEGQYVGTDRNTKARKWTATPVDLMFGSSAELRAIAEVYAANDGNEKFVDDFVAAWVEVMNNDRFDLKGITPSASRSVVAR
jgi:catalase-peroxidase